MTDEQMEILANRIREKWLAERHETTSATPNPPQLGTQNAESRAIQIALNTPAVWELSRKQRGRLRQLEHEIRNPDLSGLSGPTDEDYKEFPQLRELERSQLANRGR